VLENASVTLFLYVLEIVASVAVRRIPLAHVAQPAGEFGQTLAIRTLSQPVDGEVRWLGERGPSHDAQARL
jgi:hypothetical protein